MTGKELIFWSKRNVGVVQWQRDAEEYNMTRTQNNMNHGTRQNDPQHKNKNNKDTKQKITTRT